MDPRVALASRRWICAFRADGKHLLHVTIESPTSAWRHHWPREAGCAADVLGTQIQRRVEAQLRMQLTRTGLYTTGARFMLESIEPINLPTTYRVWINASPYDMKDVERAVRVAFGLSCWYEAPPDIVAFELRALVLRRAPVSPVSRLWYKRHRRRDVLWAIRASVPAMFLPYTEAFVGDALWVMDRWVDCWILK